MLKAISYITKGRGCKRYNPGLLLIFMLLSTVTMAKANPHYIVPDTIPPQILTVANIAAPAGNNKFYEVTFYQSARFYKLLLTNKNCKQALLLLKQSKKTNRPVQVILTQMHEDIIDDVRSTISSNSSASAPA
jgi:hypothetical protein